MKRHLGRRSGWLLVAWILFAPSAPAQQTFQDCPDCPRMAKIPAGTFTMGSPASERERRKFEGPRSDVTVATFAIGTTEVTRKEYAAFVADTNRSSAGGCFTYGFVSFSDATVVDPNASWRNPAFEQTDEHPVVCVSWEDARDYAAWLARKTAPYRLPSEAEWEYSARPHDVALLLGPKKKRTCEYANAASDLLRALPALHEEIAKALRDGDAGARFVACDDGAAFTGPDAPLSTQCVRPLRHDRQRVGIRRGLLAGRGAAERRSLRHRFLPVPSHPRRVVGRLSRRAALRAAQPSRAHCAP
jgi:hypothetical protein